MIDIDAITCMSSEEYARRLAAERVRITADLERWLTAPPGRDTVDHLAAIRRVHEASERRGGTAT